MNSFLSNSSCSLTKDYVLPESIKMEMTLQIYNEMDISAVLRDHESLYDENLSARVSAEEMDEKRHQNIAYEYLCHLEEAKKWIESCIREELPSASEFEENLRNGVYLAKLSNFFCPEKVPFKKIYDRDQSKYTSNGLQFRHTDNINHFFNAMEHIGLPKIFFPETTDVYDKKNMPRAVYCLHALSLYLFKLGIAPQIQDLYGVAKFTEEEITAMAKELKKYGLELPAFSKIGGILANEMPVDEAALHAAILAINDSIERKNLENLSVNLKLPDAHLFNVIDDYVKFYMKCMYDAKTQKSAQVAKNKSNDANYLTDVYDELLTQAEIQLCLNKVNVDKLIIEINECIDKQNRNLLLRLLKSKASPFKNVFENYVEWYLAQLTQEKESKLEPQGALEYQAIQNAINVANLNADNQIKSVKVLELLNNSLAANQKDEFIKLLQKNYQLFQIDQQPDETSLDFFYAGSLYYAEFKVILEEKQSQLELEDFVHGLKVLCQIVQVNKFLDYIMLIEPSESFVNELYSKLSSSSALIQNVKNNPILKKKYFESFIFLKQYKNNNNTVGTTESLGDKDKYTSLSDSGHSEISYSTENSANSDVFTSLLTHGDIQDLVVQTNADFEQECLAVVLINESIEKDNYAHTLYLLKNSFPHRDDKTIIIDQNAYLYHFQMKILKNLKKNLDIDDIKDEIKNCNIKLDNALNMTKLMIRLNQIDDCESNKQEILALMREHILAIHIKSDLDCLDLYFQTFKDLKRICKSQISVNNEYFWNKTTDDLDFYFNLLNPNIYSWTMPVSFGPTPNLITRTMLKKAIENTTEKYEQNLLYKSKEALIIKIQALVRGRLVREYLNKRYEHFLLNKQKIVKIQAWWRSILARKIFLNRVEHLKKNTSKIILIQSYVKMWLNRRRYLEKIKNFKLNENSIIKIQSYVRSKQAKEDYLCLINEQNPPLRVVRKFVYLLEESNCDFTDEIELQDLKRQIITAIKMNKNLEQELDMMDVKIGLLVKNRITLQDVLMQHKKLRKYKEDIEQNQTNQIKQLSKENHLKMELYQNLFYLLQTNPIYLAKLLYILPTTNTSKFIETVVLQLFNYAANSREEYLLLKLFNASLQLEIESKVDKMSDIITGTPLVVKVIVSLYRKHRGENILRTLLNQTIEEFLNIKNLQLCLNPSELYKIWINKIESDTGKPTGLPYEITNQKALEHEEIRKQFDDNIKLVKHYTKKFLNMIIKSIDKLPYGLRYIAKILRVSLRQKFPSASEREILKIIGNLVYYRFINSAICSPDAYDVIDIKAGSSLNSEQRKNLACIAKHLQLISMSKGYGDTENAHLACLNPFIKESHEQIRSFFSEVCNVCDADEFFGIDEYSDLIVLTKPIVYMTVQEICDTHKILVQHLDKIAPENNDPLREIFNLLQFDPNLDSMTDNLCSRTTLGNNGTNDSPKQVTISRNNSNLSRNTQLCLTLTNRFTPNGEEKADLINLFIKTKRLIIELIHCQCGDNLKVILNTPCTFEQEILHQKLVKKRLKNNKIITGIEQLDLIRKSLGMPLEDIKREVRENLIDLEQADIVSSANNYQSVISRIGQDIRNQRKHRQRRQKEMSHLKQVFDVLKKKQNLLKEQVSYYNEYVKACLDGFNNKKGTKSRNPFKRKEEKVIGTIKYSAAKLYEKGVILEIEGLNSNQFKNVLFEISSTEEPGVFDVSAKFMGVTMEKVELVFQDLLQMQYEGASIMKMFDKAKINVNLLIFLLNKKFYGK